MIVPNKTVTLDESALGSAIAILEQGPDPILLASLYERVADQFQDIDHFLLTLDVLFLLERIDVDFNSKEVSYAS